MKKGWIRSSDINANLGINSIELKKKYSLQRFLYSFLGLIIFYLSYYFINEDKLPTLDSFLGLMAIIFLGISIFFLISYLILYFLKNVEESQYKKVPTKKEISKSPLKKKVIKKKPVKRVTKKN